VDTVGVKYNVILGIASVKSEFRWVFLQARLHNLGRKPDDLPLVIDHTSVVCEELQSPSVREPDPYLVQDAQRGEMDVSDLSIRKDLEWSRTLIAKGH
jgi:hypothetical protein